MVSCWIILTFRVKEVDPSPEPVEETHVDEDPGGVVLHVSRILGAVIRVIPERAITTLFESFLQKITDHMFILLYKTFL